MVVVGGGVCDAVSGGGDTVEEITQKGTEYVMGVGDDHKDLKVRMEWL